MEIFIAIIICVFFYLALNSRITSIEESVRNLKKGGVKDFTEQKEVETPVVSTPGYFGSPVPESIQNIPQTASKTIDEETGGRILAVVGIIAVFLGLAFFLKFAFDNNLIGITTRIVLGYAVGILVTILGLKFRARYKDYADTLTGGGIAILYLTTFAAYDFYQLFNDVSAYTILIAITIFACTIAILLSSEALVALSFIGAFAAPFVMSLYQMNMFPLLGYLLILSLGNAVISYSYKWTRLNLIGIIGTFLLLSAWLGFSNLAADSDKVLAFLFATLYFAIFLISTMMHHVILKQISEAPDAIALGLNGLFYGGIGYELLNPIYPSAMGYFMLVIAIVYFLAALISFETNREDKIMNAVLPAISAFFITIAIPIHFHGSAITVAWIVEALLMFIIEYSVRGKNLYVYGAIVYIIGLINLFAFHLELQESLLTFMPIFNERFMLFALAAIAGFAMAYIAHIDSKRGEHETAGQIKIMMAAIAEVIGLVMLTFEINAYFDKSAATSVGNYVENVKNTAVSIGWVSYATIITAVGFAGRYKTLRIGGLILFFITAIKIFMDLWAFGPLYRIVASIVFGALALLASFAYSKFKDRLLSE